MKNKQKQKKVVTNNQTTVFCGTINWVCIYVFEIQFCFLLLQMTIKSVHYYYSVRLQEANCYNYAGVNPGLDGGWDGVKDINIYQTNKQTNKPNTRKTITGGRTKQ